VQLFFTYSLARVFFLSKEYQHKSCSNNVGEIDCSEPNVINILGAAFAPLFFCQKITKQNCN